MVLQLNLSYNQLCSIENNGNGTYTAEGITAISDALRVNGALTSLDLSMNALCGVQLNISRSYPGTYTAEGITAIGEALRVNGGLTKMSLAENFLEEEGTKAICEALEQNTTLKELDISGDWIRSHIGGSAGAETWPRCYASMAG